jgi:quercetin dioxygenase-like cupin family protein
MEVAVMLTKNNSIIQQFVLPGLVHQTLASHNDGLKSTEVWLQIVEPSGETPVHYHDCEEVVVIIKGSGRLYFNEKAIEFVSNSTLIIPPNIVHQIVNNGTEEIFLIASFPSTPAKVFTPDGEELALPWHT